MIIVLILGWLSILVVMSIALAHDRQLRRAWWISNALVLAGVITAIARS